MAIHQVVVTRCPSCGVERTVPAEAIGRKAKCQCGSVFRIQPARPAASPHTTEPPAEAASDVSVGRESWPGGLVGGEVTADDIPEFAPAATSDAGSDIEAEHPKEERTAGPSPLLQEVGSSPVVWSDNELIFEGSLTPNITLLEHERVLNTFEAGMLDLGPLGWLFRDKRRLVLTTHRLFRFDKKIFGSSLEIVWLRSVKSVVVGHKLNGLQLFAGFLPLLAAFELRDYAFPLPRFMSFAFWLFLVALGIMLIVTSRKKVMLVSTGQQKTGLQVARIRSEESARFANLVFEVLGRNEP